MTTIVSKKDRFKSSFHPSASRSPSGKPSLFREFTMADGRPILIEKRTVGFVCQAKDEPKHLIVGLKVAGAKAVVLECGFCDFSDWLRKGD